jgi:hypothetical protein
VLNIAGADYDYAQVVYVVLQECEHRRRAFDEADFDREMRACVSEKMAEIKATYDEFGGAAAYWDALDKEVEEVVLPEYLLIARDTTELERNNFGIWRGGDLAARFAFALIGLTIGGIIVALPFIPIFEDMFAFALMAGGFVYPDLKRFMFRRRYMKGLNRIVSDSARYQENGKLHYMTSQDIQESFEPGNTRRLPP